VVCGVAEGVPSKVRIKNVTNSYISTSFDVAGGVGVTGISGGRP